MKIDPICHMEVPEDQAIVAEYEGRTHYFCSEGCRDKFIHSHARAKPRSAYDLIIIGGGPAGMTAAVYAATLKIDTFVAAADLGGQAIDSTKIKNYMGYDFITGPELADKFKAQLLHSNYVDHRICEVEKLEPLDEGYRVTLSDLSNYTGKAVLLATGMSRRKLGVPGEEQFQRKGVFYGNVQDVSFVQGEDVVVVGGGNSAMQIVENLLPVARRIHIVSDLPLTADPSVIERAAASHRVHRHEGYKVRRIEGGDTVEITYKDEVYDGEHPAIVDEELFERAQRLLKRNGRNGAPYPAHTTREGRAQVGIIGNLHFLSSGKLQTGEVLRSFQGGVPYCRRGAAGPKKLSQFPRLPSCIFRRSR